LGSEGRVTPEMREILAAERTAMRPIFHPSLVNGRFADPTVYVETLFEKHSLLCWLRSSAAFAHRARENSPPLRASRIHQARLLAHPCSSEIYEEYVRSAERYVLRAEQANGVIPRRNGPSYVWGAALGELDRMQPDARWHRLLQ
jgi:hypothetical protein